MTLSVHDRARIARDARDGRASTADLVALAREAGGALRRREAQLASGAIAGHAGTALALKEDASQRMTAVEALRGRGRRDLVGLLVAEDDLARRMQAARAAGQMRPELHGRLVATRRDIRVALSDAD